LNNFYTFLLEHEEEIEEARGAGRFKAGGKYIPRKITVHGKEGTFQATRYFKPKESKIGRLSKSKNIENEGWESTKVEDSFAGLGSHNQHRVSKDNKSLDFFNEQEKTDFDKHWGSLSYNDVHKMVNPLGLPGKVEIQQQRNNESFFTVLFKGSTQRDANGNPVPINKVDKGNVYQFEMSMRKRQDELFSKAYTPDIGIEYARVPDSEQGSGFMRKFFESALPHWDSLGIKQIDLFANVDSGSYSWAKYGFDFHPSEVDTYKEGLQKFLYEKGKKLKDTSLDKIKHSWEIAGLVDPTYNHEKHGNQIGKDFMLTFGKGNGWRGILNLEKGSPGRVQFESYVKGKVLPETLKQLQGPVAQKLLGHLSPENQIKALVHDRIKGPLTTIGPFLDRGNYNAALDRFNEVSNHIETFAEASKGIEVGLLNLLHKELLSSIATAPMDFHKKLHEKVFNAFQLHAQPYLTKMSKAIETKSKKFSEDFKTKLKEEAKTFETYKEHGLQGFKHLGKLKDIVHSPETLSYMGDKLNIDVFASNNLNGNPVDGFAFARDPNTKKPFVAINPLNFKSVHERQLLVKANEINITSKQTSKNLNAIALSIKNLPIERGIELDSKGNIILTKDGTDKSIHYTDKELADLKNKKVDVSIHNHPGGGITAYGPPSFEDLGWACSVGCKQISTVSQHEGMLYSLRPKKGQEKFSEQDLKSYKNMFNRASREAKDANLLSILTEKELASRRSTFVGQKEVEDLSRGARDETFQHRVWQRFSELTGVQYEATPISSNVSKSVMDHVQKTIESTKAKSELVLPGKGKKSTEIPSKEKVQEQLKEFMPIAERIAKEGGRAFIVGGFVRDLVMGNIPKDIDVEVHGLPQDKLEKVLGMFKDTHGEAQLVGKAFGVYKLGNFDIAMPRTEKKVGEGHKGFEVNVNHEIGIEAASKRRDLKFNSMLYDPIEHKVMDPHGGIQDIKNKEISHTDEKAFAEDPLRVFRVARFAATTGFKVHPETTRLSKSLLNELATLPKERLMGEVEKILLKSDKPSAAFRWLDEVGALEKTLPELHALKNIEQGKNHHPEGNALEHTMLALDIIPKKERTLPVMLGILAHDLGKATVKSEREGDAVHFFGHAKEGAVVAEKFLKRLTDEKGLTDHVLSLVRHHMKPYDLRKELNKTALKRLGLKVNVEDLMMVHRADKLGRGKEIDREEISHIDKILTTWNEIKHETKPMVLGRHLITMGMKPGKHFGEILNKAFQAQLDGAFSTHEDGIAYVKNKILKKK